MLPIDPLTSGALIVLAASVNPACAPPAPASISIIPRTSELVIDTSRKHHEIQDQQIDTINPFGYNTVTHTNGFMEGQLELRSSVGLDFAQIPQRNAFCVWYKNIDVTIDITPKITIASEIAKDKCMYNAVLEHEMKHVNTDKRIINAFAQTVGNKVYEGMKERGFSAGPMPHENMKEIAARMRETVQQLVEFEYKKFEIERAEAQQKIDNLTEYQAVQAKCPRYRAPSAPVSANIGND